MACIHEGCERESRVRGLCLKHYQRARWSGTLPLQKGNVTCSVKECAKSVYAKGLCGEHYGLQRTHGDPNVRVRTRTSIQPMDRANGYREVRSKNGKIVPEHRQVMERVIGRPLEDNEIVFHINGVRSDNRIDNLRLHVVGTGYTNTAGYRIIRRDGQEIPEHRYIMSQILGRSISPLENVHHKNGDRSDNRPENLELWSKSQPSGQRVLDKLKWAREILARYESEIPTLENLERGSL